MSDATPGTGKVEYAASVHRRSNRALRPIEEVTLAHTALFILGTTWGFGGAAEWLWPYYTWWGAAGIVITLTALQDRDAWREGWMRPLRWSWPILALNVVVISAALNPSFKEIHIGNEIALANTGGRPWWPTSARPQLAVNALLLFDALWITCFNVALIVRHRRAVRGIVVFAVVNALALAVFGTAQKLAHASGIYFGAVPTKQPYFFASFVYHNHWGAFILLMLAAAIGLVWHFARRHEARNFLHSPAFGVLVVVFFLAATVPLSGSRSATLGMLALFAGAFAHFTVKVIRARRHRHESAAPPLIAAAAAACLAFAGVWSVAKESITVRAALTRQQVGTMVAQGGIGSRATLYHDTWRMGRDKPWFGWGMASYPHVFSRFYNTQTSPVDRLPVFYRDAHSDWLQAFAEHGLVGAGLLALAVIVPLLGLRPRHFAHPFPQYLLVGCALVLLYAWIEFPFGNFSVVLTWWLCYFCAVHYARLQRREAILREAELAST